MINQSEVLKPVLKRNNPTIGIFTPSFPAHIKLKEKFDFGVNYLESVGYKVIKGSISASDNHQNYRSASSRERAFEFMELIENDGVDILMSTVGGMNSSSLLKFLDYDKIRQSRKVICGYSDVTAIHMAIYTRAGLSTFYGPAIVPTFGEWPQPDDYTLASFNQALFNRQPAGRLLPPRQWSNHFRDYFKQEWNTLERRYQPNEGWRVLRDGCVEAPIIVANLNTLLSLAGTIFFPDLSGKILLLEEMNAPMDRTERSLQHLQYLGVFSKIKGLIFSKIEFMDSNYLYSDYEKLLNEIVDEYSDLVVITNFDCGHTTPSVTLAQNVLVKLEAKEELSVQIMEPMIEVHPYE